MSFAFVSLEHFRTFRKRAELPLADLGLVLVRGDNRVSSAADSNGVGKTGVLHALSWGGWGRDLDGLGAEDVACRFTKDPCLVEIALGDGTLIRRGQRPAGVALRDAKGDWWTTAGWAARQARGAEVADAREIQAKWDAAVGYGWRTFCNAVVFGQETFDRFARAEQGEQMRMLDEIQGLDFRKALDRAKAWRDEWTRKLDSLIGEETAQVARRDQARRQIEELEAALATFRDGKAARVEAAEARAALAEVGAALRRDELDGVKAKGAEAKRLRERWDRLAVLQMDLEKLKILARDAALAVGRAKKDVEEVMASVERLVQEGTCPTCRRPVKEKAEVAQIRRLFAPTVKAAERDLADAQDAAKKAETTVKEKTFALDRLRKDSLNLDERVVAAAEAAGGPDALERARRDLETALRGRELMRLMAKTERAATWDGQAALDAARTEAETAGRNLGASEREQARARNTVRAAEYWVEAFGDRGLRSLLFDSVADFLNERLAAHLAALTAGEATVEASALTALKGGGTKERLSLTASWAWGAGGYAAQSAGQRRRVDLPLFLALQDLAEQRSARPFSMRAWDEPEGHLDARGRELFAAWAQAEAQRRGTGLFITQSEEMAGLLEPDRTWTVVLDAEGSRVEIT